MHPALIILSVVFAVQLVNLVGRDRIEGGIRPIYIRLFYRKDLVQQKKLKKELFETRQQLNLTSSQDEFAKWAKLRRSVDKLVGQLEASNARLAGASSSVHLLVRATLFLATTLFPFCLTFYFGKTPMFFLPPSGLHSPASAAKIGLRPIRKAPGGFEIPYDTTHAWGMINETYLGPLGWVLSLTAAPRGSVSAGMWSTICTRVALLIIKQIQDLFTALFTSKQEPESPISAQKETTSNSSEKVTGTASASSKAAAPETVRKRQAAGSKAE